MGTRDRRLFALLVAGVLIISGCGDSGTLITSDSVASTVSPSTTTEPLRVCDQRVLTIAVEPSVAPAGSLLYLEWEAESRAMAVSLDDGDDIWIMDVSFEQTGIQTVPLGSPGTFPPAVAISPAEGFLRLPKSLKDGCYLICGDPGRCGSIIVDSKADVPDFSHLSEVGVVDPLTDG